MLHNIDKVLGDKGISAMDDGSRCLADVINDPKLLQSFLENDNGPNGTMDAANKAVLVASKIALSNDGTANGKITSIKDSRQVNDVTSSRENISPTSTVRPPSIGGQLLMDDKSTVNIVSSSVGLIPLSNIQTAAVNSISLSQPATVTTYTSTTTPLRTTSPAVSWPSSFQISTSRTGIGPMTMQLPQQLIVPTGALPLAQTTGGLQQIVLTPRSGAPQGAAQLPPGIQPGQLVQIIHTPSGTQMIPATAAPTIQVPTTTSTNSIKSSSNINSSRSNKQILPKPPGSMNNNSNNVQSSKNGQLQQGNTIKVINNLQQTNNAAQFATNNLASSTSGNPSQQIIINSGGQQPGVIAASPQGFLLNHIIPGLGPQPILIQGNIGNVPGSVQLTLRPQPQTSMVSVSGASLNSDVQNSALLTALAAGTQAQVKPTQALTNSQPHTIVIPNHASVNNSSQGMVIPTGQSGMMMTTGPRGTPNIILTRPPLLNSPQTQQITSGQQLLQIQTPNGPVFVALQAPLQNQQINVAPTHTSTVQNQNQAQSQIQLSNTMIPINTQTMQSNAHPALQALLSQHNDSNGQTIIQTAVNSVPTSNTVIFSQNQMLTTRQTQQQQQQSQQQNSNFIVSSQNQTKNSAPSLNLAELLKETGILPDSSPPTSPVNNSTDISSVNINDNSVHANTAQPTVLMVQNQPNILLTQSPAAPNTTAQIRLALAPDGMCSVILQPTIASNIQCQSIQNTKSLNDLKDNGLGSSQPSPDSTTPTLDAASTNSTASTTQTITTTTTSTAIQSQQQTSNSALLDQLNAAPAIKVPDLVASIALQNGPKPNEENKASLQQTLLPLTLQNINNSNSNTTNNGGCEIQQPRQTILTIPVANGDNAAVNTSSNAAVIRIGNCDTLPTSLVLTTPPTSVFASPTKQPIGNAGAITVLSPSNNINNNNGTAVPSSNGNSTTVIDHNGVPMIQVSPNNQEFLQRLDTQLKGLLALKTPTQQQKDLLNELLALQQKMLQARQSQNNSETEQKVVLTTPQVQFQLASQNQSQQQPKQTQNLHLVNLLNQNPVNQNSHQQIRLLTPVTCSPTAVSGTTTIQLGNQLITFATPGKQVQSIKTNQTQAILRPQLNTAAPTVFLRLQTPTQTLPTTIVSSKTMTKTVDHHSEHDRKNIKILKLIQQQLMVDQAAALKPDTKTPFKSRDDACKRLLRYHVFNTPTMSLPELEKSDELFETVAQHLLHKKQQLFDKFRILLLKQSMKETISSEHVMLDRMFINEETSLLKTDKELVAEGKQLNLPPLPESWYQMLRRSIEEEEEKLNINRKRKSSISIDEEYQSNVRRRHGQEESEDSEDDEEDSDDDDDDDDDEVNQVKDVVTSFLSSVDTSDSIGNVENYYDYEHHHNLTISSQTNNSVSLNNYPNGSSDYGMYSDLPQNNSQEWTNSIISNPNNSRISWSPHGYGVQEAEASVAVESILAEDDETENDISVDLSAIGCLDDNLDDENEEGDEEDDGEDDDEEDGDEEDEEVEGVDHFISNDRNHQSHDVQMQCAIKSILDISVQQTSNHSNSYLHPDAHHHPPMNDFTNYYMPSLRFQRHLSNLMPDCVINRHSNCANDLILDEAVKSILP